MTQNAIEQSGWTITKIKDEGLSREYKVIVAKNVLTQRVQSTLGDIASQASLPGFRQGKVPVALIEKRYGDSVLAEVIEKISREGLQKLFVDEKIQPVIMPSVKFETYDKEKDFSFSVTTEIFPEITFADLASYEFEKPSVEVSDKNIQETLADELIEWVESDATEVKDAECVVMGKSRAVDAEGNEIKRLCRDDFQLYVSSEKQTERFACLKNMKVGETRTVKYPKLKDEIGVEAFDLTLEKIKSRKDIAPTDEVAVERGFRDLADWKEEIKAMYAAECDKVARNYVHHQILERLEETHEFPLPTSLINQELHGLIADLFAKKGIEFKVPAHTHEDGTTCAHDHSHDHQHPDQQKIAIEGILKQADEVLSKDENAQLKQKANKRVKLALLISALCKKHDIQVTDGELRVAINKMARGNPANAKMLTELYEKNMQMREELRAPLVEKKAMDFVMNMAKLSDKKLSLEDFRKWAEEKAKIMEAAE